MAKITWQERNTVEDAVKAVLVKAFEGYSESNPPSPPVIDAAFEKALDTANALGWPLSRIGLFDPTNPLDWYFTVSGQ